MKFGPVPIEQAVGKILGHNIAGPEGRRELCKGARLGAEEIEKLRRLGRRRVYVAELEPGDVEEDAAAQRVAEALAGQGLSLSRPSAGRVNLLATALGVLRVDIAGLEAANAIEGINVATLPAHSVVQPNGMAATVKIIPYALAEAALQAVESGAAARGATLWADELPPRGAGLILSGTVSTHERLREAFEAPLCRRLEALGARVERIDFVPLETEVDEAALAETLQQMAQGRIELVILAGETAIMDRGDIAPRAIERAGGRVECVGVPVDPGNLLMLGYLGEIPVLGAPGCARSLKINAIDWILPRLLSGERVRRQDLARLGHGGLLEDTSKRPMPRSHP